MKRRIALIVCVVMLATLVFGPTAVWADPGTIDVSTVQNISNTGDGNGDGYYERDPELLVASSGTWYLIYSRSRTSFSAGGDCDALKYDIYYQTSTDNGANWSAATKVLDEAAIGVNADFRSATICEVDGKIWVIGANVENLEGDIYANTHSSGSWSGQSMIFDGTYSTGAYHVDCIAEGDDIRLFYGIQKETNGVGFIKYNGSTNTWDSSVTQIGASAGYQIPRVIKEGSTYHLVSTNWNNILYTSTTTPDVTQWPAAINIASAPVGGASCDPSVLKYGSSDGSDDLIVFHAPGYSDDSQPQEYVYSTDAGSSWSPSIPFTDAAHDGQVSWDMMPRAYMKDANTIMVFFGMEQRGVNRGQGDIVVCEWSLSATIGNAHYTTIQDAVDNASTGDTINVAAGTYTEQLVIDTSVTLNGAQAGVDARGRNGFPESVVNPDVAYSVVVHADNVTIDGFEFTNDYATNSDCTAIYVSDCVSGGSNTCLTNAVIKNNIIHDMTDGNRDGGNGYFGIVVGPKTDGVELAYNEIRDLHIKDDTYGYSPVGIMVWGDSGGDAKNTNIHDNKIHDISQTADDSNQPRGIQVGCDIWGASVAGNEIYNVVRGRGIRLGNYDCGGGGNNDIPLSGDGSVSVTDNNIHDCGQRGIQVEFPATITGNTLSNNGVQIVDVNEDLTIEDLLTDNTFDRAVTVDHPGASLLYTIWSKIQDGVDAAVAGDTVNVAAGTYNENVVIAKSLHLLGADKSTTTIDGNGAGNAVTITASDVAICRFRVTGGWSNGNDKIAFHPYGGVVVDGNGGAAALTGITIEDNIINGNSGNGVYVSAAGHGGAAGNVLIKDCQVFNNGEFEGSSRAGISLTYPNYDIRPVGIWDEWRRPKNVLVQGNVVYGNHSYGVYVSAGQDVVILSNIVRENSKYGVQLASSWNRTDIPCENTTVENNDIYDNVRNGVKLTSFNQHNTLAGNRIYNNGIGYTGSKDYYEYGILFQDGNDNTIENNAITGNALGGLYLWGNGDPTYTWYSTTNNTITGNTISDHTSAGGHGIYIPARSGNPNSGFLNSSINENSITNNLAYGLENADTTQTVDAQRNWWGDASGPSGQGPSTTGDAVSTDVDYSPWLGNYPSTPGSNTYVVDPSSDAAEIQAIIDSMTAGDTLHFTAGNYAGGFVISKAGIIITGDPGAVIGHGSHGTTVNANDVTIHDLTFDGSSGHVSGDCGIVVNADVQRLYIHDCEIRYWPDDGIHFNGAITGLKILDNYVHNNAGDGMEFKATPDGTIVQIYGNAFRSNTGYGINAVSPLSVIATYNEWGHVDGPTVTLISGDDPRDAASSGVTYNPWVFGKLWVDAPDKAREEENFTVYIKTDAYHLYGVEFDLTFDTTYLEVISTADGDFKGSADCDVDYTTTPGTLSYYCSRQAGDGEYDAVGGTILAITFKAKAISGSSAGPTKMDLESDSVVLSAIGGVNVFVDDAVDDDVEILGTTTVSGVVDLQGRGDDSGAVVTFPAGPLYVSGSDTTDLWGRYDFADVTDATYISVTVEMERYLDAAAVVTVSSDSLTLNTVVLLGGDTNDSDYIDISDLSTIGGAFGTIPNDTHWNSDADINADDVVNILDLVLAGGNWHKSSPVAWS